MNRLRHRKPLHPKRASRAVGACVCLITSRPSCAITTYGIVPTSMPRKRSNANCSMSAYVDNILRHHLEYYREEINRLHKQRNSQNIL